MGEKGCDIRNSVIGNDVVVLGNSTVLNSRIYLRALIKDSVICSTLVGGSELIGVNAEASEIAFSNCKETTIKSSKVKDMEIGGSYISKCDMTKGSIVKSIVRLSQMEDCTVANTKIEREEYYGKEIIEKEEKDEYLDGDGNEI